MNLNLYKPDPIASLLRGSALLFNLLSFIYCLLTASWGASIWILVSTFWMVQYWVSEQKLNAWIAITAPSQSPTSLNDGKAKLFARACTTFLYSLLILLFPLLSGCDYFKTDPQGRVIAHHPKHSLIDPSHLRYIIFDDHEYVFYEYRGGITHSPNCPCLSPTSSHTNRLSNLTKAL